MKSLWMALKLLPAALAQIKEADRRVSDRFSDAWWAELRACLERWVLKTYLRADKGILRLFDTDNAFLRGMLVMLKSDHLYALSQAKTPQEREQAILAIMNKNAESSIAKLRAH